VGITRVELRMCQRATPETKPPRAIDAEHVRWLAREFPTVSIDVEAIQRAGAASLANRDGARPVNEIDLGRWRDRQNDFAPFDAQVEALVEAGEDTLVIEGPPEEAVRGAGEMLTRWQRFLDRRNVASSSNLFDDVLARLRSMHDLQKPLVRADWNHALDTWQWSLRLDGDAPVAPQLAALLHDVERLESEADARVEHLAPSYDAFKRAHAERGAAIAAALLDACGADPILRDRVSRLVAGHERPEREPDRRLLNDADALSFFSQNSAGYRDYFGPAQTREKIAYSLRRMSPAARARLATVRLRADVGLLLEDVTGYTGGGEESGREAAEARRGAHA